MKTNILRVLCALTLGAFASASHVSAQGSYPSNTGTRWRAFPMTIGRGVDNVIKDNARWAQLKSKGCNTIRACIVPTGSGNAIAPIAQITSALDAASANAQRNGMNLIINYHTVSEFNSSANFTQLNNFWNAIAPRYNNRNWIHYEVCNEPCTNVSRYNNPAVRSGLLNAYNICKTRSNNGLLMFSFNALDYDILNVVDNYNNWGAANGRAIAWNRTGVAWHFYSGTWNNYSQFQDSGAFGRVFTIMFTRKYRTICTELFTKTSESYVPDNIDFVKECERGYFKQSWAAWRDWTDTSTSRWDAIRTRAARDGYNW